MKDFSLETRSPKLQKPRVLSWSSFALLGLLGLGACGTNLGTDAPGKQSSFHRVADAKLAAQVRGELLKKLGKDALGIQPKVVANKATLWGQVRKRSSQELAKEIALSVAGISRVRNRIQVKPPKDDPRNAMDRTVGHVEEELRDAALENRVGLALLGEVGRHALHIEVESSDGVVSLRGPVPDLERRDRALKTAEDTRGVKEVIDLLAIQGS